MAQCASTSYPSSKLEHTKYGFSFNTKTSINPSGFNFRMHKTNSLPTNFFERIKQKTPSKLTENLHNDPKSFQRA